MKKCPYCAEEIQDEAVKCKYCDENLHIMEKINFNKLKQLPLIIKTAILIIVSSDILTLIFNIVSKDLNKMMFTAVATFLDFFFVYYLFKMKNWARLCIIGRSVLTMILLTSVYFAQANYYAWIIDISIFILILILLFGSGSRKKALITISIYLFLVIISIIFYGIGIKSVWQTKNIIKNSPLIMEQNSETGFKIILPSNNWKFIKKEDGVKLIGDLAKKASIIIANNSGKMYGIFNGEDLRNIDKNKIVDFLIEDFKKDLSKDIQVVNEYKSDDGMLIESKYNEAGTEYMLAHGYKIFEKTGVVCDFLGELTEYENNKKDITDIISNIKEISRKQFLPKVSSQDIYKKNSDAVVLIRLYDKNKKLIGYSSGFNIDESGIIVTNLHVIMAGFYMDIKFPYHGVYEDVYIGALSKKLHDLVILKIDGKNLPYVNLDDSMDIEIGDKVIVVSNPEGLINSISEGIISGFRSMEDNPYYQMTAPISSGSSGGAVFNEFGNIIGISSGAIDEGQNLNFCIPITEVADIEAFEKYITLSQFQEFLKTKGDKK